MPQIVEPVNRMNGRDARGRWLKGGPGGPGRPPRPIEERYLKKFREACSARRFARIVAKCVEMAAGGDTRAQELLFKYSLARPKADQETGSAVRAENAFVLHISPEGKEALGDELRQYHNKEAVRTIRTASPTPPDKDADIDVDG